MMIVDEHTLAKLTNEKQFRSFPPSGWDFFLAWQPRRFGCLEQNVPVIMARVNTHSGALT